MAQTEALLSTASLLSSWATVNYNTSHYASFKAALRSTKDTTLNSSIPLEVKIAKDIWVEEATTTITPSSLSGVHEEKAQKFKVGLEACLDADVFEPGLISATEHYIEKWLQDDPMLVQISMGKIFLACSDNQKRLVGILNAIAHLDRETFHPVNELITQASLSNVSVEVKECAIRVYEYWEDPSLIEHLKNHQLTPKWLDDYRKQVITDFCGAE